MTEYIIHVNGCDHLISEPCVFVPTRPTVEIHTHNIFQRTWLRIKFAWRNRHGN